jgi:hypothetical protein
MKKICFFSSDARPLYKNDVFRVVSYPDNYIIHFRYLEKYIEGDPIKLIGKNGIIFFTMGNDLSKPQDQRNITNTSVREVVIHAVEKADDTGQVHIYLKLKNLKTLTIGNNPANLMPPNKFVTELELIDGAEVKWHQIIDTIKDSFKNQLFYKFKIVDKKSNKAIDPEYDKIEKQSFYKLSDEKSYALEMAFYDTEPGTSDDYHSIRVTPMDTDLVKVVAPANIDLETRRDNRVYSIFTRTLNSSNSFTYINFETLKKTANAANPIPQITSVIDTTLKIEVKKNVKRTLKFAFFSILAAIALGYAKILSDKLDLDGTFDMALTWQFILCSVLGFWAAFNLYRLFDKK